MIPPSDGTRIITNYTIEDELIICEWSEDELQRYFGYPAEKEDSVIFASSNAEFEDTFVPYTDYYDELRAPSEGFVSVLLTFRMEHKDYATVFYDQSAVGCTVSMPDDLRVNVSGTSHYEVSIGDQVNLQVINARTPPRYTARPRCNNVSMT